ncbi:MAG: hypothetical protein GXP55_03340 [Deltaproteobacteria bacterium]|nr:hypothetical protein [Deltaproteobacteria bacterium]
MAELTKTQRGELVESLRALVVQLAELLESTREDSKPVDLDQPIGRLSRMDAMQQQSMAQAARRGHELRLKQVRAALAAVEAGEYGDCRSCEEPIGYGRLKARPETPFCVACQSSREQR